MYAYDNPYVVNPSAGEDSLEAKRPLVDNGLDVPHPERYYAPEFMKLEWRQIGRAHV